MFKLFRGGVHPDDMNRLSKDCPIEVFPLPDEVRILMSQHLGAPCAPCVKKGDRVRTGQVVGRAQGFVSAPVHASVTGTVKEVGEALHPVTGKSFQAVVIEREGEDEWAEGANAAQDVSQLSADEIKDRILAAGIVGLGGATFPTHVKLSPPKDKPIDTVILNAAECEPYLTSDYRLMMERADEVVEGFSYIMRALGVDTGVIGIEDNKPDAAERMRQAAEGKGMSVETVRTRYPQGAEGQLIYALCGREIPAKGGLPMDVGCVVQNVATSLAVRDAVKLKKPLIERLCTVTGDGVEKPMNVFVRIGAPVRPILEKAGLREEAAKFVLGGPLMGLAQRTSDQFVAKGTGGILVLCDAAIHESGPCIKCGRCVDACPWGLTPAMLSRAVEADDLDACLDLDLFGCKQCGCCTYVCPSKRPIVHQIKTAMEELKRRKAEADAKAREEEAKANSEEAPKAASAANA